MTNKQTTKTSHKNFYIKNYVIPYIEYTRFITQEDFKRKYISRCIRKLEKVYGKINIIYAHSCCPGEKFCCEYFEDTKIPVVVTEHFSGIMRNTLNRYQREEVDFTIKKVDKVICVSEAL